MADSHLRFNSLLVLKAFFGLGIYRLRALSFRTPSFPVPFILFSTSVFHVLPRDRLISDYEATFFFCGSERLRQRSARKPFYPLWQARKGCSTRSRACGYALKNVSLLSLTCHLAHRSVFSFSISLHLHSASHFLQQTRFLPTLLGPHLQVFLRTALLKLFAALTQSCASRGSVICFLHQQKKA